MESNKSNKKIITKLLLLAMVALVAYFASVSIIESRFTVIEDSVRSTIDEQKVLMTNLVENASSNSFESVDNRVVRDCPLLERDRYNVLLSSLDKGLSRSELLELSNLFGRCGSFQFESKSLLIQQLEREVEVYGTHVQLLSTITQDEKVGEEFDVTIWSDYVENEAEKSDLLYQLVNKQDQIISTLLEGKSSDSDEIKAILQEVSEINQTLEVVTIQASVLQDQLISS